MGWEAIWAKSVSPKARIKIDTCNLKFEFYKLITRKEGTTHKPIRVNWSEPNYMKERENQEL